MGPRDLLAAADAFRRLAEAADGVDARVHWYGLADRAWCAYEAEAAQGCAEIAAVNSEGRIVGQGHHRARLSDADVELVHELREAGFSLNQIAAKLDVARSTVADICSGRTRSHSVMGHRVVTRLREPLFRPASVDEFEVCG